MSKPYILPLPGAEWQHRDRLPGGEWSDPIARTDCPKVRVRSTFGRGGPMQAEYRPPTNVGGDFYKTLCKLGYTKRPEGDYR